MSGAYNEGVDNLRRYLAIANNALERLQAATPQIEAHGQALEALEDEVDSKLSAFDSDTDGFLADFQSAETDALSDVALVTSLAQNAADDRLPDGQADLEEAGARIGQSVDALGRELTSDQQALNSEGFDALVAVLDASQQAYVSARGQNEGAFQALSQAIAGFEQEAETAYAESGKELEGAATECDDGASTLASETAGLVQAMEGAGAEFGGKVAGVETEAEAAYDGVNEQVENESRDLNDGVQQSLQAETQHLATELADSVEQASAMVANDTATPHLAELGTLHEAVWRAESAGADLDPLVGDLQRCQQVVDLIENLLNAME